MLKREFKYSISFISNEVAGNDLRYSSSTNEAIKLASSRLNEIKKINHNIPFTLENLINAMRRLRLKKNLNI